MDIFGYRFADNKACLICEHVFDGAQIKLVVHNSDGLLQFLCGEENHDRDKAKTVALANLARRHDLTGMPPLMHPGFAAALNATGTWSVVDVRGTL